LSEGESFFDKSFYQLSDAQGSIVGVVAAQAMALGSGLTINPGRMLERVEYDPYGRARRISPLDVNPDNVLDSTDYFLGTFPAVDFNNDGVVDSQDAADYTDAWNVGDTTPLDGLSASWIGNPYGYCGYYGDVETRGIKGTLNGFLYHCRHREYDPIAGRWLQRDPAGFVDGCNLYQYVNGKAGRARDPFGLAGNDMGCSRSEWRTAQQDAGLPTHYEPPTLGGEIATAIVFGGPLLVGAAILAPEILFGGAAAVGAEGVREMEMGGGPEVEIANRISETVLTGFSEIETGMIQRAFEDLEDLGYDTTKFEELVRAEEMGNKVAMSLEDGAALGDRAFASQEALNSALEEELIHLHQAEEGLRETYGPETAEELERAADAAKKLSQP
jgi:RHS repeat-associated protein